MPWLVWRRLETPRTPMSRKTLLAVLALAAPFALSSAAAAAQEKTIDPGYWDVTNKVQAVITKTTRETRCIKPAEVAKFTMGPSNRHYACTYPTRVFKDGKITLKGTCASKKGRQVAIEATGSYSPSTFKLTADVDTTYAGIPLGGRFITDAKKISDTCPAGAKEG
mgnify:CR=1 FL=1